MNILKPVYPIAMFLGMLLSGCQQDKAPTKITIQPTDTSAVTTTEKTVQNTNLSLAISSFKGLPEEVHGCSCYFSETEERFKNEEYLFAANYDSIGFISINNKLTKLKLLSTEREPNTFGAHDRVDVYSSECCKVTVDIKYVKAEAEEVWWNKGTIAIKFANGTKATKQFVGECGC